MIKLVAIDADDTLFMTEEVTFHIENELAAELGFPPMTRDDHQRNWGKTLRHAIPERIPGIDADAFVELVKKRFPEYVSSGRLDALTPENQATLEALKSAGKKMAILTSREKYEVDHFLDPNHVLQNYMHGFYHRDNTDYVKPDPRVFDVVLKYFEVTPNEVVYVGDTPNDGKAAKGAGLHFIALLESGHKTKEDFDGIPVDFFAQTFPEILSYIENH